MCSSATCAPVSGRSPPICINGLDPDRRVSPALELLADSEQEIHLIRNQTEIPGRNKHVRGTFLSTDVVCFAKFRHEKHSDFLSKQAHTHLAQGKPSISSSYRTSHCKSPFIWRASIIPSRLGERASHDPRGWSPKLNERDKISRIFHPGFPRFVRWVLHCFSGITRSALLVVVQ